MATRPEQVIVAYNRRDAQIRDRTVRALRLMWQSAGSWRTGDVDRLVARIVPAVEGAKRAVAGNTAAYAQAMARVQDDRDIPMALMPDQELRQVRGVDPEVVYRRPATQMYTALAGGASFPDALRQGVNRLASIVTTDLQLAKTHQERRSWQRGGYRYTIRTLTGRENCALCVIASTQRYTVEKLRPIHPGCDCGSRQISARHDPGQVIDQGLLDSVHDQIETHLERPSDRGARDLGIGKTDSRGEEISDYTELVVVREHGEIGPLLTWRDQKFTSKDDI